MLIDFFSLENLNFTGFISNNVILIQIPVSLFKEKIANDIGVPVGQQRLIFRGKVLKDEHLLSEYRIPPLMQSLFLR